MNTTNQPLIWVLADDRPGNVNQCLGVAEALNLPFEQKNIRYNPFTRLPNFMRGSTLWGIDKEQSDALEAPYPDIVIAAGRRTAPIARHIKRMSEGKTLLVQIMWPDFPNQDFDIIAVPEHDNIPHKKNLLPIVGSPSRISEKTLANAHDEWLPLFESLPSPRIALLVGGSTKRFDFTSDYAHELGIMSNSLANDINGSLLITTSRRTSDDASNALMSSITCSHYHHNWRSDKANPYMGYLACADAIIVTGDSMSMCSEAIATGKPTYIYAPTAITSKKHGRLHDHIISLGYAKRLTGEWHNWSYQAQNPAIDIARAIRALISL